MLVRTDAGVALDAAEPHDDERAAGPAAGRDEIAQFLNWAASPEAQVALTNGGGHPRGIGTYARVLGRYVREEKQIDLMTALRKISLMPAQRLEPVDELHRVSLAQRLRRCAQAAGAFRLTR